MNRVLSVTRMHLGRRVASFVFPLGLALGVVLAMVLIVAAIRLAGVDTMSEGFARGTASNGGIVWTLVGFSTALGVQAATACFALATALGTTRRDYVLGTAAYFAIQGLAMTAMLSVLLVIERATEHWFLGARTLDVVMLGSGDWGRFLPTVFLGSLAALALGALLGASWLRFGNRGPAVISGIVVLAAAIALVIIVPRLDAIVAAAQFSWVPIGLAVVTLVAFGGAAVFLRRTSVRGN
ncbi:hypothetical protein [Aestuariimicrobium ganziense]|uniref:hypothetical protein n=1 Tax=Aestuariimicrobium ganziense TaxID=2773677 RepID=UPI0019436CC7|nr:hypothetical protein [Aestuariimicrobium ganziense]